MEIQLWSSHFKMCQLFFPILFFRGLTAQMYFRTNYSKFFKVKILPFTHSHTHSCSAALYLWEWAILGSSISHKDTLACEMWKTRSERPTFWLEDDLSLNLCISRDTTTTPENSLFEWHTQWTDSSQNYWVTCSDQENTMGGCRWVTLLCLTL